MRGRKNGSSGRQRGSQPRRKSSSTAWASYGLSPELREVEEIESPRWNVKERPRAEDTAATLSTPQHRRKRKRSSDSDSGRRRGRGERERETKRRRRSADSESTGKGKVKERYVVQSLYGDESESEETPQETMASGALGGTPLPQRLDDSPPLGQREEDGDEEEEESLNGHRKAALLWISPMNATAAAFEEGNALLDISNHCLPAGKEAKATAKKPKRSSRSARHARGSRRGPEKEEEEGRMGLLGLSGSPDVLGLEECSPLLAPSPLEEDVSLAGAEDRRAPEALPLTPLRAKNAPRASSVSGNGETARKFVTSARQTDPFAQSAREVEKAEPVRSRFVIPRPKVTATGPGGLREFSLTSAAP